MNLAGQTGELRLIHCSGLHESPVYEAGASPGGDGIEDNGMAARHDNGDPGHNDGRGLVDDLTCPVPWCQAAACSAAARYVIAAHDELPAECANRSRLAECPERLRRAVQLPEIYLTWEARRLLALRLNGASPQHILRLLIEGRLVFLEPRTPRPLRSAPPGHHRRQPPPAASDTSQVRADDKVAWIKIRVVDDGTSEPLPGVALQVTQPNRKTFEFMTRADGAVEVHGIDPGACDVTCELENARITDTYDFVAMGDRPSSVQTGEGADEAPDAGNENHGSNSNGQDPPASAPGPSKQGVRIARVEEHKVRTGESIRSLADANGLTWQQLARFNWGTDVPDEINKKLRDEVGCTQKAPDGVNYRFDDGDDPGIVYIPKPWNVTGLATEQTHTVRVRSLQSPSARIAYIRLWVYDEYEEPLAGVSCTITDRDGTPVFEEATDAQGRIRKDDVEFDDFRLEIDGFERIIPSVAYEDEWIDVFQPQRGHIRLLVHDESEQPLRDAPFVIEEEGGGRQLFAGTTGAEGRIKRNGVALTDYRLTIGALEQIIPAVAYDDEWIDVFTRPKQRPGTADKEIT